MTKCYKYYIILTNSYVINQIKSNDYIDKML